MVYHLVSLPDLALFREWTYVCVFAMEWALHRCIHIHSRTRESLSHRVSQSFTVNPTIWTTAHTTQVPSHVSSLFSHPPLINPPTRSLFYRAGVSSRVPGAVYFVTAALGLLTSHRCLLHSLMQTERDPFLMPLKAISASSLKN